MEKIVLLCDYGLDDAAATLFVLDNRGDTAVDVVAIAGNSPVSVSHANAVKLLSNYEGSLKNVRLIDTGKEEQNYCKLPSIHGNDGLGDFLEAKRLDIERLSYAEWLKEDDELNLVSLGPCTLTRQIIDCSRVKSLLIMAGNVSEVPNFNGYEFNHYLDRPAFAYCVKNYKDAVVATLDSCRTPSFNFANKTFSGEGLLSRTLERSRQFAVNRHPDNCYVYDYIAVQYLFTPEKFIKERVIDPDGNRFFQLKYIEEV